MNKYTRERAQAHIAKLYCHGFVIVIAHSQTAIGKNPFEAPDHGFTGAHFHTHLLASKGERRSPLIHQIIRA